MSAPALKLYELSDELDIARDWIAEHAEQIAAAGGELPPELAELLDAVEGEFREKVERVALAIREQRATALAIAAERDRLADRVKAAERAADGLTRYLQLHLERAGVDRVEGTRATVRLQANPPKVVGEASPEMLAALRESAPGFVRVVPERIELDRRAVLDYWKANDGLLPIAELDVVRTRSVRIV